MEPVPPAFLELRRAHAVNDSSMLQHISARGLREADCVPQMLEHDAFVAGRIFETLADLLQERSSASN